MNAEEIEALLPYLTEAERKEFDELMDGAAIWYPLPGPQTMAYNSIADVIGYGGAAGGGKTDLAVGKALTQHKRIAVFRRVGTELVPVIDRFRELIGHGNGYNGTTKVWREPFPNMQIEFGSVPNLGDEKGHQGHPKDLLILDEAANFLEVQARFLMGWVRTTTKGQRCQTLMTFNPPTNAEGRWIIRYFAPWLDKKHPNKAKPGELRWFAMVEGVEVEVDDSRPFVMHGLHKVYDFDPRMYKSVDIVKPQSRTFIPSRISDNPYLVGTNYMATLQAMPEPLRSQMLNGDFEAGTEDDAMQVIPTAWVEAAQARWKLPDRKPTMLGLGVDVARGGKDRTVIARKHEGLWFDRPIVYAGKESPDGPTVAGFVIAASRDRAPIHIDVIGVGSSPYDFLVEAHQPVIGVNVAEKALGTDQSGRLRFANQRSELWWRMREALDPANNTGIALPPDSEILADLCAPTWKLRGAAIQVESREDIVDRIGRSPDYASAYVLALIDTPRAERELTRWSAFHEASNHTGSRNDYDPYRDV